MELNESDGSKITTVASNLGRAFAGSLAVATTKEGRHIAAICLTRDNALAIVDLDSKEVIARIDTGMVPFAAVLDSSGTTAWVSNWGGRRPGTGEQADPMGLAPDADRVVVDPRGIASSGTLTRIDLTTRQVTGTINVGLHPTALLLDEKRHLLYVANSNGDSVAVVDTKSDRVHRHARTQRPRQGRLRRLSHRLRRFARRQDRLHSLRRFERRGRGRSAHAACSRLHPHVLVSQHHRRFARWQDHRHR